MLLSVCITLSARADRAENAFVKVRAVGADVTRVDGRNFSAQGDTEVEIAAQPGWTLLTPSRVRVTKGQSPRYRVKSVSNEDDGQGDIYWTTTEHILRHMEDPTVTADVSAGGPYVYAAPQDGTNAVLSCSASATLGMHVWETRTTVYKNGAVVSTSASNSDPFPLELDQWSWEWSLGPENGTTNVQSFSTEPIHLSSGTYPAEGTVTASSSQCGACHATDVDSTNCVVCLLSIVSQTVKAIPEPRTRLCVGVGEEVDLTLTPDVPGVITWSKQGDGSISPTTGKTIRFTAGEVAASTTISASCSIGSATISFTTIPPTEGSVVDPTLSHQLSRYPLGIRVCPNWYIGPTTVNLSKTTIAEQTCDPVVDGYFLRYSTYSHIPGTPAPVTDTPSSWGWKCAGYDDVRARLADPVVHPYTNGTFSWPIPWHYEINGNSYYFTTINHDVKLYQLDIPFTLELKKDKVFEMVTEF